MQVVLLVLFLLGSEALGYEPQIQDAKSFAVSEVAPIERQIYTKSVQNLRSEFEAIKSQREAGIGIAKRSGLGKGDNTGELLTDLSRLESIRSNSAQFEQGQSLSFEVRQFMLKDFKELRDNLRKLGEKPSKGFYQMVLEYWGFTPLELGLSVQDTDYIKQ